MGRNDLVLRHRNLMTTSANLRLLDITQAIAERAAELRARYNLRLPDAFQIAAALDQGASHFITNDAGLKRVTDLTVLVLKDYLLPTVP